MEPALIATISTFDSLMVMPPKAILATTPSLKSASKLARAGVPTAIAVIGMLKVAEAYSTGSAQDAANDGLSATHLL